MRPTPSRSARLLLIAQLLTVSFLTASGLAAESLRGSLRLVEDGKDRTAQEARSAVLWVEPAAATSVEPMPEQRMTMKRKEFDPRVLVVTRGTSVRFPNDDPILHNVFSVSGRNRFDLGLYRRGEGETTVFDHAGVVRVYCNVHHSMIGYVAVVDTPYYQVPTGGEVSLDGLPKGRAKITVWHERAEPMTIEVDLPTAKPLALTLELTKPRVPRHRNKFGEPYSRRRRGRAY